MSIQEIAIPATLIFTGILIVVCGVHLFLKRRTDQRLQQEKFFEVELILKQAIAERAAVTVFPHKSPHVYRGILIGCAVSKITLCFETSLEVLDGRAVEVAFSVEPHSARRYCFHTKALSMRNFKGYVVVEMLRPDVLDFAQRRRFVRFKPSAELLTHVKVWFSPARDRRAGGCDQKRELSEACGWNLLTEPAPTLQNISAGGLCLLLNPKELGISLAPKDMFVVQMILLDPPTQARTPLLVTSRVVWTSTPRTDGSVYAGVTFVRMARMNNKTHEMEHSNVPVDSGVPELAYWVMVNEYRQQRKLADRGQENKNKAKAKA